MSARNIQQQRVRKALMMALLMVIVSIPVSVAVRVSVDNGRNMNAQNTDFEVNIENDENYDVYRYKVRAAEICPDVDLDDYTVYSSRNIDSGDDVDVGFDIEDFDWMSSGSCQVTFSIFEKQSLWNWGGYSLKETKTNTITWEESIDGDISDRDHSHSQDGHEHDIDIEIDNIGVMDNTDYRASYTTRGSDCSKFGFNWPWAGSYKSINNLDAGDDTDVTLEVEWPEPSTENLECQIRYTLKARNSDGSFDEVDVSSWYDLDTDAALDGDIRQHDSLELVQGQERAWWIKIRNTGDEDANYRVYYSTISDCSGWNINPEGLHWYYVRADIDEGDTDSLKFYITPATQDSDSECRIKYELMVDDEASNRWVSLDSTTLLYSAPAAVGAEFAGYDSLQVSQGQSTDWEISARNTGASTASVRLSINQGACSADDWDLNLLATMSSSKTESISSGNTADYKIRVRPPESTVDQSCQLDLDLDLSTSTGWTEADDKRVTFTAPAALNARFAERDSTVITQGERISNWSIGIENTGLISEKVKFVVDQNACGSGWFLDLQHAMFNWKTENIGVGGTHAFELELEAPLSMGIETCSIPIEAFVETTADGWVLTDSETLEFSTPPGVAADIVSSSPLSGVQGTEWTVDTTVQSTGSADDVDLRVGYDWSNCDAEWTLRPERILGSLLNYTSHTLDSQQTAVSHVSVEAPVSTEALTCNLRVNVLGDLSSGGWAPSGDWTLLDTTTVELTTSAGAAGSIDSASPLSGEQDDEWTVSVNITSTGSAEEIDLRLYLQESCRDWVISPRGFWNTVYGYIRLNDVHSGATVTASFDAHAPLEATDSTCNLLLTLRGGTDSGWEDLSTREINLTTPAGIGGELGTIGPISGSQGETGWTVETRLHSTGAADGVNYRLRSEHVCDGWEINAALWLSVFFPYTSHTLDTGDSATSRLNVVAPISLSRETCDLSLTLLAETSDTGWVTLEERTVTLTTLAGVAATILESTPLSGIQGESWVVNTTFRSDGASDEVDFEMEYDWSACVGAWSIHPVRFFGFLLPYTSHELSPDEQAVSGLSVRALVSNNGSSCTVGLSLFGEIETGRTVIAQTNITLTSMTRDISISVAHLLVESVLQGVDVEIAPVTVSNEGNVDVEALLIIDVSGCNGVHIDSGVWSQRDRLEFDLAPGENGTPEFEIRFPASTAASSCDALVKVFALDEFTGLHLVDVAVLTLASTPAFAVHFSDTTQEMSVPGGLAGELSIEVVNLGVNTQLQINFEATSASCRAFRPSLFPEDGNLELDAGTSDEIMLRILPPLPTPGTVRSCQITLGMDVRIDGDWTDTGSEITLNISARAPNAEEMGDLQIHSLVGEILSCIPGGQATLRWWTETSGNEGLHYSVDDESGSISPGEYVEVHLSCPGTNEQVELTISGMSSNAQVSMTFQLQPSMLIVDSVSPNVFSNAGDIGHIDTSGLLPPNCGDEVTLFFAPMRLGMSSEGRDRGWTSPGATNFTRPFSERIEFTIPDLQSRGLLLRVTATCAGEERVLHQESLVVVGNLGSDDVTYLTVDDVGRAWLKVLDYRSLDPSQNSLLWIDSWGSDYTVLWTEVTVPWSNGDHHTVKRIPLPVRVPTPDTVPSGNVWSVVGTETPFRPDLGLYAWFDLGAAIADADWIYNLTHAPPTGVEVFDVIRNSGLMLTGYGTMVDDDPETFQLDGAIPANLTAYRAAIAAADRAELRLEAFYGSQSDVCARNSALMVLVLAQPSAPMSNYGRLCNDQAYGKDDCIVMNAGVCLVADFGDSYSDEEWILANAFHVRAALATATAARVLFWGAMALLDGLDGPFPAFMLMYKGGKKMVKVAASLSAKGFAQVAGKAMLLRAQHLGVSQAASIRLGWAQAADVGIKVDQSLVTTVLNTDVHLYLKPAGATEAANRIRIQTAIETEAAQAIRSLDSIDQKIYTMAQKEIAVDPTKTMDEVVRRIYQERNLEGGASALFNRHSSSLGVAADGRLSIASKSGEDAFGILKGMNGELKVISDILGPGTLANAENLGSVANTAVDARLVGQQAADVHTAINPNLVGTPLVNIQVKNVNQLSPDKVRWVTKTGVDVTKDTKGLLHEPSSIGILSCTSPSSFADCINAGKQFAQQNPAQANRIAVLTHNVHKPPQLLTFDANGDILYSFYMRFDDAGRLRLSWPFTMGRSSDSPGPVSTVVVGSTSSSVETLINLSSGDDHWFLPHGVAWIEDGDLIIHDSLGMPFIVAAYDSDGDLLTSVDYTMVNATGTAGVLNSSALTSVISPTSEACTGSLCIHNSTGWVAGDEEGMPDIPDLPELCDNMVGEGDLNRSAGVICRAGPDNGADNTTRVGSILTVEVRGYSIQLGLVFIGLLLSLSLLGTGFSLNALVRERHGYYYVGRKVDAVRGFFGNLLHALTWPFRYLTEAIVGLISRIRTSVRDGFDWVVSRDYGGTLRMTRMLVFTVLFTIMVVQFVYDATGNALLAITLPLLLILIMPRNMFSDTSGSGSSEITDAHVESSAEVTYVSDSNVELGSCGACRAIVPLDSKSCTVCRVHFVGVKAADDTDVTDTLSWSAFRTALAGRGLAIRMMAVLYNQHKAGHYDPEDENARCLDGSRDMRYHANRGLSKLQ